METTLELRKRIHELIDNADEALLTKIYDFLLKHLHEIEQKPDDKVLTEIKDIHAGELNQKKKVRKDGTACN